MLTIGGEGWGGPDGIEAHADASATSPIEAVCFTSVPRMSLRAKVAA